MKLIQAIFDEVSGLVQSALVGAPSLKREEVGDL